VIKSGKMDRGVFCALCSRKVWVLFGLRPFSWRLRIVRPAAKANTVRTYIGPLEIEVTKW